jgi:hypothetical protein
MAGEVSGYGGGARREEREHGSAGVRRERGAGRWPARDGSEGLGFGQASKRPGGCYVAI